MSPESERDHQAYFGSTESFIHIEDLLDFSNVDVFDGLESNSSASSSPANTADIMGFTGQLPSYQNSPPPAFWSSNHSSEVPPDPLASTFSDDLPIPSEDVAELEWLSKFVEDSFTDSSAGYPAAMSCGAGVYVPRPDAAVPGRARSKRSRAAAAVPGGGWTPFPAPAEQHPAVAKPKRPSSAGSSSSSSSNSAAAGEGMAGVAVRRCTHCATEKTPQWRTGPMGPKSLCNACGVRYKSGRLVPEYRPAASPTFVLTQHSNSHRKVMELRRQKEVVRQDKYFHDFKVC